MFNSNCAGDLKHSNRYRIFPHSNCWRRMNQVFQSPSLFLALRCCSLPSLLACYTWGLKQHRKCHSGQFFCKWSSFTSTLAAIQEVNLTFVPDVRPFNLPQAFVDFFSRGLQAEYKSKGIIVQVSRTSAVALGTSRSCVTDSLFVSLTLSPPPSEREAVFRGHQDEQHQTRHAVGAHSRALRLQRPQHRGTGDWDQRLLASRSHGGCIWFVSLQILYVEKVVKIKISSISW